MNPVKRSLSSPPTVSETISEERIYAAVKALEKLLCPDVPETNIRAGNQNDMALPAGSNEYIINTITAHVMHGTPIVDYPPLNGPLSRLNEIVRQLAEIQVQIDCYSGRAEPARLRAQTIAALARTTPGHDFLNAFGVSSLYADTPTNLTVVGDADKFVHRWTTTLHIVYWHTVDLDVESFNAALVGVQNVDVRFPHKEKRKK
ncbi:LIC_12616 family protein [uncultured Sutterella sp.]|uniref:phage neck terminator protein n=1 Tax=uncultured Sutterella sp. TaxID=286133 RepID=UPI00205CC7AA|nr:hypothetical protein [uncultured Sutterella sp.]DAL55790.1 MAG TPA_asm: tail completion protein [Caudoviricetes sp.]